MVEMILQTGNSCCVDLEIIDRKAVQNSLSKQLKIHGRSDIEC